LIRPTDYIEDADRVAPEKLVSTQPAALHTVDRWETEMESYKQVNVRVPDQARDAVLKLGAILRDDPRFLDSLKNLIAPKPDVSCEPCPNIVSKPQITDDDGYLTLSLVLSSLRASSVEARNVDEINDHKLCYSNAAEREASRLSTAAEFISNGMLVSESSPGRFIVNDHYEIAPLTKKWRVLGKAKWYRYRDAEQFKSKFIDKND
jgi:hypothetical protein